MTAQAFCVPLRWVNSLGLCLLHGLLSVPLLPELPGGWPESISLGGQDSLRPMFYLRS